MAEGEVLPPGALQAPGGVDKLDPRPRVVPDVAGCCHAAHGKVCAPPGGKADGACVYDCNLAAHFGFCARGGWIAIVEGFRRWGRLLARRQAVGGDSSSPTVSALRSLMQKRLWGRYSLNLPGGLALGRRGAQVAGGGTTDSISAVCWGKDSRIISKSPKCLIMCWESRMETLHTSCAFILCRGLVRSLVLTKLGWVFSAWGWLEVWPGVGRSEK